MVGQHIRILKDGRWVHAVDCGDETVLHLAEEAPPPRVRRAYRPEFVAGADAIEVVTHRERTFPAKEIVRRAYSRASDPALAAMFHDSESFVEWCTTGRLAGARNVAVGLPAVAPPAQREAPRAPRNGKATARKAGAKVKAAASARGARKTSAKAGRPKAGGRGKVLAKPKAKRAAAKKAAVAKRPAVKKKAAVKRKGAARKPTRKTRR